MAEITLNIYKKGSKTEIEKTYKVEGYDLMLGTVEEFMLLIDADKMDDKVEIAKMVLQGYSQLKPFVKDVFPELTDDEYKRVKVNDLVNMFVQLATAVITNLRTLDPAKNATGA